MTPESLFRLCNLLALIGWLLLVFLGRKRWVSGLVTSVALPLALAAVYCLLILIHWGEGKGSFSTLDGVASLFTNRWLLLAGWIHYLAFDLFVGSWEARDGFERKIPHLAVVPCLIATFFFGPAGLLLYFAIRAGWKRRVAITDNAPFSS